MSKVLTNNQYYSQIANVIREQNGTNNTYKPPQMVTALKDLFYEEVEGVPPITFQGIGENLLDYRIDGASGGVGDRTINIFDGLIEQGTFTETGLNTNSTTRLRSTNYAPVNANTIYTLSLKSASDNIVMSVSFYSINDYVTSRLSYTNWATTKQLTFTTPNNCKYIRIIMRYSNNEIINSSDVYDVQINEGSEALLYEPHGYKVPVVMNGKNLFDELQVVDKTASSESSNYQIFKQNEKLIINGLTTSSQADVEIANINSINNQALQFINSNKAQYIFSAEVPGRIMIRYKLLGSDVVRYTFDEYNSSNRVADRIVFRLQQNYQYNNEQMNIMFKLNKIQSTNYEPYHEPTTTTIYLDEPIEENESISLSDTNVSIPTIRGTNVLSIDTTVQPSNVYVKSRHESSHEAQIRQLYESVNAELTQYKAQYGELGGE